jgi:para-nitrobenzyl esterase
VLGEEDCLTLNVWTHAEGGPRPVMVFVHGGGFVAGASSLALFEASSLARGGDVVVVTLNYRLGALGFLATEALAAESGDRRPRVGGAQHGGLRRGSDSRDVVR